MGEKERNREMERKRDGGVLKSLQINILEWCVNVRVGVCAYVCVRVYMNRCTLKDFQICRVRLPTRMLDDVCIYPLCTCAGDVAGAFFFGSCTFSLPSLVFSRMSALRV